MGSRMIVERNVAVFLNDPAYKTPLRKPSALGVVRAAGMTPLSVGFPSKSNPSGKRRS